MARCAFTLYAHQKREFSCIKVLFDLRIPPAEDEALEHSPEMFASFFESGSQCQSVSVFLNNGLDWVADFRGQLFAC